MQQVMANVTLKAQYITGNGIVQRNGGDINCNFSEKLDKIFANPLGLHQNLMLFQN